MKRTSNHKVVRSALGVVLGALALTAAACGSGTASGPATTSNPFGPTVPSTSSAATTTSVPSSSSLAAALEDAYRAETGSLATYKNVVAAIGAVGPFPNIVTAEQQHVGTLAKLISAYGLHAPPASTGQTSPATLRLACQLGATTEQGLISLYSEKLPEVRAYPAVTRVFQTLQTASRDSHLVSFQHCA